MLLFMQTSIGSKTSREGNAYTSSRLFHVKRPLYEASGDRDTQEDVIHSVAKIEMSPEFFAMDNFRKGLDI